MYEKKSYSNYPRCNGCNASDEHTTYVLQCKSKDTCSMRLNILTEFRVWLKSVHTHTAIECFLFNGIKSWLTINSYSYDTTTSGDPVLQVVFCWQKLIGWEALFNGFVVMGMIEYQQRYYIIMDMRKTGNRWRVQLITHIWTIVQFHWIHRNQCLNETEALVRLSGVENLKIPVGTEYKLGLGELPLVYRQKDGIYQLHFY